jgi:hypothetical protein
MRVFAGLALFCGFAFIVLEKTVNQHAPYGYLFGILAGLCVIIAGIAVGVQNAADVYHGNELVDKLPPAMQKISAAYYIRKLFPNRTAYARFNLIFPIVVCTLMGIALAALALNR